MRSEKKKISDAKFAQTQKRKEYLKQYARSIRKEPAFKEKVRDYKYRKLYGITLEDYNSIWAFQGFKCALCGKEKGDCDKHFPLDHNHRTHEVRGIICNYCNRTRVGRHSDSIRAIELLKAQIEYLSNPPANCLKSQTNKY